MTGTKGRQYRWTASPDSARAKWFAKHPVIGVTVLTLIIVLPMSAVPLLSGAGVGPTIGLVSVALVVGWIAGIVMVRRQTEQ